MQYINNNNDILEKNMSLSGSTVTNVSVGFYPRVNQLGNPNLIFIALGTNDSWWANVDIGEIDYDAEYYDESKFAPAYIKGMKAIKQLYPHALVICISFNMRDIFANTIKEIAEHYDAIYIDAREYDSNDGYHPTKKGMNEIFKCVSTYIDIPKIEELIETFKYIDESEYINVTIDSSGKVINGITKNGEGIVGGINVNQLRNDFDAINPETIKQEVKDAIDEAISGIGEIGDIFYVINDPNNRLEVITDNDDKILSYRKPDGVNVESVGIETQRILLNGDDVEQILKVKVNSESYIYSEKPKFGEFRFYGDLPTDASEERTPTSLKVAFKINNKYVFFTNCKLSIQGHGSAVFSKHNYTIDFLNADGDELAVKFGDMIAVDSFHLKGYYSDVTHSRGIGGMNWYREMVKYLDIPYNKINNIPLNTSASQDNDCRNIADAQYGEQGFPFEMYINDTFYGLYTLKLKKTRQNYAMQKAIKSEIFLDCIYNHADLDKPFDYTQWDVKNPKLKNYEEGGEVTDAAVLASINRLFGFLNDIDNQYLNYSDYIVLQHWLLDIIFVEVIGQRDFQHTVGNNTELFTWDNEHWSILPYDLDNTVGLDPWTDSVLVSETGFLTDSPTMIKFRTYFDSELKALYTKLRNNGVISVINGYKYYVDQCSSIPREVYKKDYAKWGSLYTGYPSMEQIYAYLTSRIEFLDSEWLINN